MRAGRPSRVPRPLARRLDRLARRAHLHHRYAHHPLCPAYAGELVRLGRRTRLCRGCLFVFSGLAAGALSGLLSAPWPLLAAALPLALAAGLLRRRSKLATRLLPSALAAALFVAGLRAFTLSGAALASGVLLAAAAAVLLYRRRGPDRSPCQGCPERTLPRTCTGLRPLVRREAAFARASGRLLAGLVPQPPAP